MKEFYFWCFEKSQEENEILKNDFFWKIKKIGPPIVNGGNEKMDFFFFFCLFFLILNHLEIFASVFFEKFVQCH